MDETNLEKLARLSGKAASRPSARLSDGVMTSVEICPAPSAEFPVAILKNQNPTTEPQRK